jgi:signal transduction histidine kinase
MTTPQLKSLRHLVNKLSAVSIAFVAILTIISLWIFSDIRKTSMSSETKVKLESSLGTQLDRLLPTFLLPEQREGLPLLLERFKSNDGLVDVGIFMDEGSHPSSLDGCNFSKLSTSYCENSNLDVVAVVAPILEGDRFFGFYYKIKSMNGPWLAEHVLSLSAIILAIFAITFLVLQRLQTRLLSQMVPESIDRLISWIDSDLNDTPQGTPNLWVTELETLRIKISESLDRYKESRDQAVIGQLTSGIMHDLKTPLQSLVSAINLVETAGSTERRNQMLQILFETSRDNVHVIQDIIETTLDGNREIALRKISGELQQTIEFVVKQNKEIATRSKVQVSAETDSSLQLSHDPTQLSRALSNLIKNGIEAAAEGHVDRRVLIRSFRQENSIVVSVSDTGPGLRFDPKRLFRVFRSSKVRGAGLGLLITKRIVEAHGGSVEAIRNSELGGAEFRMSIPGGPA